MGASVASEAAVLHTDNTEFSVSRSVATLRVSDDGTGFEPVRLPRGEHYGLMGIRERAEKICGDLQITSLPGKGVEVCLTLPLAPPASPGHRKKITQMIMTTLKA